MRGRRRILLVMRCGRNRFLWLWSHDAAASAGPVGLDIKATLRDDESFRARVAKALESNRKAFKKEMHTFFQEVVAAMPSGKAPVFIVDSIDHYRGRAAVFNEVRAAKIGRASCRERV